MLLGMSGVGKSSLLQHLRVSEDRLAPFVHVTFPVNEPVELLSAVVSEFQGESPDETSSVSLLTTLRNAIRESTDAGQHAVIAFDEAHLFGSQTLNQAVLPLLNLAVNDPSLQYSVVLAGHPVLASHIGRNAQLRERISVTATLDCFTLNETSDYVESRLLASGATREIFTAEAIEAVMALSNGSPRRINRLCDMSLLVGFADQKEVITADEVRSLASEFLPAAA